MQVVFMRDWFSGTTLYKAGLEWGPHDIPDEMLPLLPKDARVLEGKKEEAVGVSAASLQSKWASKNATLSPQSRDEPMTMSEIAKSIPTQMLDPPAHGRVPTANEVGDEGRIVTDLAGKQAPVGEVKKTGK